MRALIKEVVQFFADNNFAIHAAGFFMIGLAVYWVLLGKRGDMAGFGTIAGIGTFCLGLGQWKSK